MTSRLGIMNYNLRRCKILGSVNYLQSIKCRNFNYGISTARIGIDAPAPNLEEALTLSTPDLEDKEVLTFNTPDLEEVTKLWKKEDGRSQEVIFFSKYR